MLRILTKLLVVSISLGFFPRLKCVLMHELVVILYGFKYRKSQRSERGGPGGPPLGKIKNLRKGVL